MPKITETSSSAPIDVPAKRGTKPSSSTSPKTRYDSGMDMFVEDRNSKFPVIKKNEGLIQSWTRMLQEASNR